MNYYMRMIGVTVLLCCLGCRHPTTNPKPVVERHPPRVLSKDNDRETDDSARMGLPKIMMLLARIRLLEGEIQTLRGSLLNLPDWRRDVLQGDDGETLASEAAKLQKFPGSGMILLNNVAALEARFEMYDNLLMIERHSR